MSEQAAYVVEARHPLEAFEECVKSVPLSSQYSVDTFDDVTADFTNNFEFFSVILVGEEN